MKTICFVGGLKSIHLQRWISFFKDRYHVIVITDQPVEMEGVEVHLLTGGFYSKMKQTKRFIRVLKPDIVHGHYLFGYGTFAAYSRPKCLILSAWGSDILVDARNSRFKRLLVKYALDKADVIICDGYNIIQTMNDFGDYDVHLIYHGVDTDKFQCKHVKHKGFFISVTRQGSIYDNETIDRALTIVNKKYSDIILVNAEIKHDNMPDFYNNCDIHISASLSDSGLSVSTAEAMSCGLPVIVTDTGDNRLWVDPDYIIPVHSPEVLAEKIIELYLNPGLRQQLGKKYRQRIIDKYDYKTNMEHMEELYEQLL